MTLGRILIADDHPLINEGIQIALRVHQPGYTVDVAGSIADAEVMIQQHNDYRLLLLDYDLPDSNGFNGFFKLQHLLGRVPIAMISAHDSKQVTTAARAVGASGFISKRQPLDVIVAGISTVLRGGTSFPPIEAGADEAEQLRKRMESLSNAQRRVLMALANGDLNKQIAAELGVTEATIKAHLSAIFRKLGVTNRTQAILMVRPLTGATP